MPAAFSASRPPGLLVLTGKRRRDSEKAKRCKKTVKIEKFLLCVSKHLCYTAIDELWGQSAPMNKVIIFLI